MSKSGGGGRAIPRRDGPSQIGDLLYRAATELISIAIGEERSRFPVEDALAVLLETLGACDAPSELRSRRTARTTANAAADAGRARPEPAVAFAIAAGRVMSRGVAPSRARLRLSQLLELATINNPP